MGMQLRITQRRSAIGRHRKQKQTLVALGIRRLHQTVVHNDTPQIQGMITKISHLLEVEMIETEGK
ncbi:MAG: 50S ribosomal protein L30 [Gemmatimonadota bacterium]|jgi:large subunit ribosomal protein L30|nr:50S ribosomal protein L30 [Gemmatimonadota bacterium]HCP99919.1 50S ribosomal protein L30 [Candidatus Latescibacterota bacterium]